MRSFIEWLLLRSRRAGAQAQRVAPPAFFHSLCFGLFLAVLAGACCAAAASDEESKKQNDFRAAYASKDVSKRRAALDLLDGSANPAAWRLLGAVAVSDPDKELRREAFERLTKMPAHDAALGKLLASTFQNVLKTDDKDHEAEYSYMPALGNSEFKSDILAMLVKFGSQLNYDPLNIPIRFSQMSKSDLQNIRARGVFSQVIILINKMAKVDIVPTEKTPSELSAWWAANQARIADEDRKLAEKYKAADMEAVKKP